MTTKRRNAEEWTRIVEQWMGSDLPRREFARQVGVNPGTLSWWKWRLQAEVSPAPTAFVDLVVEDPPASAPGFDLTVAGVGVHVPVGFDAVELRRLLAVLC